MNDFQERVIQERNLLGEKAHALSKFIRSDKQFSRLPVEERGLLQSQLLVMNQYYLILSERIDRF